MLINYLHRESENLIMAATSTYDLNLNFSCNILNRYISQPITSITHLEAYDNYCYVHYLDGKKDIISKCLKYLHNLNALNYFVRTHRKYAINPNYIKNYYSRKSVVELKSGQMISVARSKRGKISAYIQEL